MFVYSTVLLIINMLQLRANCAELLKKIDKSSNKTVTCIFGDHIQFEQLDEAKLLPKDVMRIVHEYFDDKIIVDCNYDNKYDNAIVSFNINDNNNKVVYNYYLRHNMLNIYEEDFNRKDDSVMIISASMEYFNLSRLYYHYAQNNNLTFEQHGEKSTVTIDNNKYTITVTLYDITYVSVVLDHEILQRRIIVMKQLVDIIKKLTHSAR